MKLLIVDDSAIIRRAISDVYEGTVFDDIQTASDGMLALTIFKKQLPDLVTLDITMPHMDGLATLTQILEVKPDATVLVISALADHHTAIESLIRGANQFICKPFSNKELTEALDSVLEQIQEKRDEAKAVKKQLAVHAIEDSALTKNTYIENTSSVQPMQYPSGFVAPPQVELPKEDSAVQRQRKFSPRADG